MRRTEGVKIIMKEVDLLEKVRQLRVKDNKVVKAIEKIKQAGIKMLRDKK